MPTRFNFTDVMRLTMCCAPLAAVDEAFGTARSAPAAGQQQPDAAIGLPADPAGATTAAAADAAAPGSGAVEDGDPAAANGLLAAAPAAAAAVLPAAVSAAKQAAVAQTLQTDQPAAIGVTGGTAGPAQATDTSVPMSTDAPRQPTGSVLSAAVTAAKQAAVVQTLQTDQPAAIPVSGSGTAGTAQPMDTGVPVPADAPQQPKGSDLSAAVSAAKQAAVVHTLQTDQPAAIAVSGSGTAGTAQPVDTRVPVPAATPAAAPAAAAAALPAAMSAAKHAAVEHTLLTDQPAAIAVKGGGTAGTAQPMDTGMPVPTDAPEQPVDSDLSVAVTAAKQAAVVQTLRTDQPAAIAVTGGGSAPLAQQQAQKGQKQQGRKQQQQQRVPQGVARAEGNRLTSIARRGGFSGAIVAAPALLPLAALQRVLPLLAPSAPFVVSHIDIANLIMLLLHQLYHQ